MLQVCVLLWSSRPELCGFQRGHVFKTFCVNLIELQTESSESGSQNSCNHSPFCEQTKKVNIVLIILHYLVGIIYASTYTGDTIKVLQ